MTISACSTQICLSHPAAHRIPPQNYESLGSKIRKPPKKNKNGAVDRAENTGYRVPKFTFRPWQLMAILYFYKIMFPLAECALNLFAKCSLNRVRHQARVPCFAKLCCTKHLGMIWISICVWETFSVSDHYTNWKVGGAILTVCSDGAILTVGSGQSSKGLIISQCMSYCKQGVRLFCCIFF